MLPVNTNFSLFVFWCLINWAFMTSRKIRVVFHIKISVTSFFWKETSTSKPFPPLADKISLVNSKREMPVSVTFQFKRVVKTDKHLLFQRLQSGNDIKFVNLVFHSEKTPKNQIFFGVWTLDYLVVVMHFNTLNILLVIIHWFLPN